MKRKLIILSMIFISIFNTFLPITNAFSIDKANLKKDHDIKTHIQYYNSDMEQWRDIECGYINYEINNKKYPAYCIVPNAHGVDEDGPYTVTITDLLKDKLIYNTMINGYPYKTPTELGVESEDDAYVATKHAIKCVLLKRDVYSFYKGKDKKGEKIINAIYNISEAGKKGNAINQDAKITVNKANDKLIESGNYYYQEYSVTSSANISTYSIDKLENFPSGSFVTDENGNKKDKLSGNQKFRVMIPKESFNKDISGQVTVTALCNTNPIFYGEAPKGKTTKQNYAVTYESSLEYKATSILQESTNTAKIKVIKKDKETSKPIENTTLGLYREDSTLVDTQKTNKDGIAVFSKLYQGKYFIKEVKANADYMLENKKYEVEAEFNKQIEIEITNTHKKGNLKIIKVDKDDHNVTLGAIEFDLIDANGTIAAHLVTDVNGEASIENINTGNYTLKETKTKREYNLCIDKDILVKWNETSEIVIENEKKKGQIKVIKQDADNNNIKLSGVKFQVIDEQNRMVEEIETDQNGVATTSRLPIGTYKLKEVSLGTNTEYILNNEIYTIEIKDSQIVEMNIYNEHKKGKLKIIKVDKDNNQIPLEGVKFEVTDEAKEKYTVLTNKEGIAELDNVRTGKVTIKEIETNKNYVLSSESYELEIQYNRSSHITIENEKKKGQLKIYKVDKDDKNVRIPNVEFQILDDKNNVVDTLITNEKGFAVSKKIPIGTYYLKEIRTDNKYLLKNEIIPIDITENRILELKIENEKIKGNIQIIKTSAKDSPLLKIKQGDHISGVKFEIYNDKNELVDTIITDEFGQAMSKDLEIGRYKVKEIQTVNNYLLNTQEYFVNIRKNNETIVLNVENEPIIPEINIEKVGQQLAEKNEEIKYDFTIENKSNSSLNNFVWTEYLPFEQITATKIVTGIYNENIDYSIYYKTNKNNYNLLTKSNTCKSEYIDLTNINLQNDEKIIEIKVEYGNVSSNFKSIENPVIFAKVCNNVKKDDKIVNKTKLDGSIDGITVTDESIYETIIIEKEKQKKLPKTGC